MPHDVHDLSLPTEGQKRISWAERHMPVLQQIANEFSAAQLLRGQRIAAHHH